MTDLLKACIASGQVDSAQIEAHRVAGEIAAQKVKKTAKQHFDEIMAISSGDMSAIGRLRFFCSFAMNAQDWMDVEPFFEALDRATSKPVKDYITRVKDDPERAAAMARVKVRWTRD